MSLTARQQQYIWIMGSYPDRVAVQGRGYRSEQLMYGLKDDRVIIFGYSEPLYWLKNRGLVRKLQDGRSYVLTEEGEDRFRKMLTRGAGLRLNPKIKEVQVK